MIAELVERFKHLVAFDNPFITIFTPNLKKAGGTIFLYYHKLSEQVIIVDAGIGFNVVQFNSSDAISPDISQDDLAMTQILRELAKGKTIIYGFVTHGHFDHTCGVGRLSKEFPIVWFGSETTTAMIRRSLMRGRREITELPQYVRLETLTSLTGKLDFGAFALEYFPVVHSIPESLGTIIDVEGFHGLHMAEFRTIATSFTPGLADQMFTAVSRGASKEAYHVVLYDELRHEEGFSKAEDVVVPLFEAILRHPDLQPDAAIITSFISSKMLQITSIQEVANRNRCVMAPAGTAMRETTEYGRLRKWIPPQKEFAESECFRPIFVCTGSQCEPGAALPRALEGTARDVNLMPNDWVVDIQGAIPHYIADIRAMYQEILSRLGAFGRLVISKGEARRLGLGKHKKIIYADDLLGRSFDMSSGHGRLDDQKLLLEAARCTDKSRQVGYQSDDDQPAVSDIDIPEPEEPDTKPFDYTALRERLLHILTSSSTLPVS